MMKDFPLSFISAGTDMAYYDHFVAAPYLRRGIFCKEKPVNTELLICGLGFYELRRTRMPAVIVEVGCHGDPQEADFIIRNVYEIGVAIAEGILNYFGLPFTPDSPEEQERLQREYNSVFL